MIKINGTQIKTPSEYQLGIMIISKSERNAKGEMISEFIAKKRKIELQWNYLSGSEAKLIESLVKNTMFFSVQYPEIDGTMTTKTMYSGDFILKTIDYRDGVIRWKDVPLSLVEK